MAPLRPPRAYTDDNASSGIWSANQVSGQSVYTPTLKLSSPKSGAYTTSVSLGAATTNLAAGTPVKFTLGMQSVTAPVVADGVATGQLILSQKPALYTLTATAAGVSASAPFTIDKDGTTLTAARTASALTATLKAAGSGAAVSGRKVQFLVNGKSVGTATTSTTGVATLTYAAPSGSTVKAVFTGDAYFLGASATA